MELYFLRHGLAGQHGDPRYKDDRLRPLTPEGKKKIHQASLGMKKLKLTFDLILSSPYIRARQTAETVAKVYKIKAQKIEFSDCLLPPTIPKQLLAEITQRFPKAEKILAVGHEPHLTAMVSSLIGSPKPLSIDFKKGSLCGLNIEKGGGELLYLLTPGQLGQLADSCT